MSEISEGDTNQVPKYKKKFSDNPKTDSKILKNIYNQSNQNRKHICALEQRQEEKGHRDL